MLVIWRRRADVAIFDVAASRDGSPRLIQQNELDPDLEVFSQEEQLTAYLAAGRTDQVAVTASVGHQVLGWDV